MLALLPRRLRDSTPEPDRQIEEHNKNYSEYLLMIDPLLRINTAN